MNGNIYYAQHGEDEILNNLFKGTTGFCIEVGGFDGITLSNTYFFEKLGWECLLIEPIPSFYEKIKKNRSCMVLNYAISDSNGQSDFFIADNVEALSSLVPDIERVTVHYQSELKKIRVERKTLNSVLESIGPKKIDFITIDVEGHELAVLKGFDLNKYSPDIIIIEDNSNGNDRKEEKYLKSFGYVHFKRTECNDWYTSKNDQNKFYDKKEVDKIRRYMIKLRLYNKLPKSLKKIRYNLKRLLNKGC